MRNTQKDLYALFQDFDTQQVGYLLEQPLHALLLHVLPGTSLRRLHYFQVSYTDPIG